MRYQFILENRETFEVSQACEVLKVSRSGFYSWLTRGSSKRAREDAEILEHIFEIHAESGGTYGSPRVHRALVGRAIPCSRGRVERLMRENDIRSKSVKSFWRPQTTNSRHEQPVFENRLPDVDITRPNQVWVGDFTYLRVGQEWCYLAAVLDLYSRKVVGWAVGDRADADLAIRALDNALETRPAPEIFHSDRGCQYASAAYREKLTRHGIEGSMSRKGNCYDNAAMESFFGTLKTERVYHESYETLRQLRASLFEYIEMFYNTQRLHSSIGYQSPRSFEEQAAA
ncbi:MAG: IS3 family transposase [Planctomycetes bacterium]|nr:IS3 family transposase [Planctomycetota bacterium]